MSLRGSALAEKAKQQQIPFGVTDRRASATAKQKQQQGQQQIPGGGQPEKKGKSDSVDVSNTTAFS
jgi:hypothetical protein